MVRSAPVVAHADPISLASFDPHAGDVAPSSHIHHVHQKPVTVPLELESEPSWLYAGYSSIHGRDNAGLPLSDLHEGGLGHVKMGAGRVAPPTVVGVLGPVGWAEVGGRDSSER